MVHYEIWDWCIVGFVKHAYVYLPFTHVSRGYVPDAAEITWLRQRPRAVTLKNMDKIHYPRPSRTATLKKTKKKKKCAYLRHATNSQSLSRWTACIYNQWGMASWASITNMVWLESQHGQVITSIINCGVRSLIHSLTLEWLDNFISHFAWHVISCPYWD